jgi:hypothetical protein
MQKCGSGWSCIATTALCAVLAGCAAKKPAELVDPGRLGDVGILAIEAAPADSYPVESDAHYDYPAPWGDNPPPAYPGTLLSQRLPPVRVRVRMIVDEGGRVRKTSLLGDAGRDDPAFFAAVETALGRWTFMPLIRRRPAAGKTTTLAYHGSTRQYDGEATALPFHQDYEFTFTQRDGIGFVATQSSK